MSSPFADYSAQVLYWWNGTTRVVDRWRQYSITKRRNQTHDFQLDLDDSYGERNPLNATGVGNTNPGGRTLTEDWANWLTCDSYDSAGNVVRKLYVNGTLGGVQWQMPTGIPRTDGWGNSPGSKQYRSKLTGKGLLDRATQPCTTLPSIISKADDIWTVQRSITYVMQQLGIVVDVSGVSPNGVIPRKNLQSSKGLQWLVDFLWLSQSNFREWHDIVQCFVPPFMGTPVRNYLLDQVAVRSLSSNFQSSRTFNKVTVVPAPDLGAQIGEASGKTYKDGYKVTFTARVPVASIKPKPITELGGACSDFWYFDSKNPSPLPVAVVGNRGPAPPVIGGAYADSVKFTFGPDLEVSPDYATEGDFHIIFTAADSSYSLVEQNMTAQVVDQSGGKFVRADEWKGNELFDSNANMLTCGTRWLLRNSMQQRHFAATLPFDPLLDVDNWVTVYDPNLARTFYVEIDEIKHTCSSDFATRQTEWTGTSYL